MCLHAFEFVLISDYFGNIEGKLISSFEFKKLYKEMKFSFQTSSGSNLL